MSQVITAIVLIGITVYCVITDTRDKKKQKQEYLNQAEYWAMRGETENADRYIEAASRLR